MYTPNESGIETSFADQTPTTYDFLKPNSFRFTLKDIPNVSYTCQAITLPSLGFGFAEHKTPFNDFPIVGEKVRFGDLMIRFIVSENMQNYIELYTWMTSLGDPDGYDKLSAFIQKRINRYPTTSIDKPNSDSVKYSDATLVITTAANIPNININFKEVFPIELGSLSFDTTVTDIQYFTCDATFKYRKYDIITL